MVVVVVVAACAVQILQLFAGVGEAAGVGKNILLKFIGAGRGRGRLLEAECPQLVNELECFGGGR